MMRAPFFYARPGTRFFLYHANERTSAADDQTLRIQAVNTDGVAYGHPELAQGFS